MLARFDKMTFAGLSQDMQPLYRDAAADLLQFALDFHQYCLGHPGKSITDYSMDKGVQTVPFYDLFLWVAVYKVFTVKVMFLAGWNVFAFPVLMNPTPYNAGMPWIHLSGSPAS